MSINLIVLILQILLGIAGWLAFEYLKQLPGTIHQGMLKEFQHDLDRQLETFKSSLAREVEQFKISQSQLQINKSQEFIRLIEHFGKHLPDPDGLAKIQADPKKRVALKQATYELGLKLFCFTSDETIKQFVELKEQSNKPNLKLEDVGKILNAYGELMVNIRKDLGYIDTTCTAQDFLDIAVKDWRSFIPQETPPASAK